ncbi:hypothetical protein BDQ17DRAFT_1330618 [Cyathus striatus]|nr:hypothetical protein BDQ17DRAFT_1330618 [Cyathus striatus]
MYMSGTLLMINVVPSSWGISDEGLYDCVVITPGWIDRSSISEHENGSGRLRWELYEQVRGREESGASDGDERVILATQPASLDEFVNYGKHIHSSTGDDHRIIPVYNLHQSVEIIPMAQHTHYVQDLQSQPKVDLDLTYPTLPPRSQILIPEHPCSQHDNIHTHGWINIYIYTFSCEKLFWKKSARNVLGGPIFCERSEAGGIIVHLKTFFDCNFVFEKSCIGRNIDVSLYSGGPPIARMESIEEKRFLGREVTRSIACHSLPIGTHPKKEFPTRESGPLPRENRGGRTSVDSAILILFWL